MSLLLQIESASKNCSVALSENGKTLMCKELHADQFVHSEKLHVFIQDVMKETKVDFKALSAVAVGKGPGSYTGLRIGVSAAKGLCFALNIPLIAFDSLTVLASPLFGEVDGLIVPMLDARRMEVYTASFSSSGEMVNPIEAKILEQDSFQSELQKGQVHFLGDGAEKLKDLIQHENALFHDRLYPSAAYMSGLSYHAFEEEQFEDVAYFEPYYLKEFVAGKPKKLL